MTRQQAGVSAEAIAKLVENWEHDYDIYTSGEPGGERQSRIHSPKCHRCELEQALATALPDKATRKDETMNLIEKPTRQEEKNFENWLEATNSDGLQAAIIKLRDAANAEVKVCPEVALRCFQEGRVQMAQNILELVPDQPQPVSAGALTAEHIREAHKKVGHLAFKDKQYAAIAECLNIALAAHDQKVRRGVLEEAADCCDGAQRDKWQGEKAGFTPEQTRLWNKWATELGDEIRSLASGAEEKK